MKVRDLRLGEYFTLKPIEHPKENQVFVRGAYCKSDRKYDCNRWDDVNAVRSLPGDREVFVDFVF